MLEVRNLSKSFGGIKVTRDVSLRLERGERRVILGPNGAGKTTLLKILLGLVRGWEGDARVLGKRAGDTATRRRIGYLPEAHRLPGYLTGRQALRLYGLYSGRTARWIETRIEPWLERVGMRDSADRKLREYSKGMQQRIGLALSLIHDPELVFLDEPTDGVDPVGRARVREIVAEARDRGVTVFVNSHLLMEVERVSDKVVVLAKGRVLREGAIEELTPHTGRVFFELVEVPEDLPTVLAGVGHNLQVAANGFELDVDDATQNRVVDLLRGRGLLLRSMTPRRLSLEESFIDLLREEST